MYKADGLNTDRQEVGQSVQCCWGLPDGGNPPELGINEWTKGVYKVNTRGLNTSTSMFEHRKSTLGV